MLLEVETVLADETAVPVGYDAGHIAGHAAAVAHAEVELMIASMIAWMTALCSECRHAQRLWTWSVRLCVWVQDDQRSGMPGLQLQLQQGVG